MCHSPSPAGMRCSPSNLVFVRIFESSNELSFEDFSSFEYPNIRSKISFESFALCSGVASGAPNFCPSVKIIARNTLPEYYTTGPATDAAMCSGFGVVTSPFLPFA